MVKILIYFSIYHFAISDLIKNVSSSIDHKKTSFLRNFSTFIYKPILMKIYMNAKMKKTRIYFITSMTSKVIEGHIRCKFIMEIFKNEKFDLISTMAHSRI